MFITCLLIKSFDEKCPVFNGIRRLDHIRCGESENDSPGGQRRGGGEGLATIAKDEKIRLPTTVYTENRYQDHIWYDESKNHPLDEQWQRGGEVPSN